MRKGVLVPIVLVLSICLFASVAAAHTAKQSNSPACQVGRTVELRDETKSVIATTKSTGGGHGNWRFDASTDLTIAHGHSYYVTVPKRVLKDTAKHLHVCKAGRSPIRKF